MCFEFLNVDSNLRTVLLHYCSRGILGFDCRMTVITEVRRGRKIKMTPVSLVRRAASIQFYSTTRMLLATWSLILISARDTVDTFPPRCVWRGKHTYFNCRLFIQSSVSQQIAKSPMQEDMKTARQLKSYLELYVTHRVYTCFIEGQEFKNFIDCKKRKPKSLNSVVILFSAFLGTFAKLQKVTISFAMSLHSSVCPSAWNYLAPNGQVFIKFYIFDYLIQNISRNLKFYWNLTRITVLYIKTFVHLWQSLSEFFLEWKIFQTKAIEEIKTYFMFNKFFSEHCAVYEIMWKYMALSDSPQMTL